MASRYFQCARSTEMSYSPAVSIPNEVAGRNKVLVSFRLLLVPSLRKQHIDSCRKAPGIAELMGSMDHWSYLVLWACLIVVPGSARIGPTYPTATHGTSGSVIF